MWLARLRHRLVGVVEVNVGCALSGSSGGGYAEAGPAPLNCSLLLVDPKCIGEHRPACKRG